MFIIMNAEKKASILRHSLEFLIQNESELSNQEKKILQSLNMKIQSAIILNMEIFRSERKKELNKLHKSLNEEYIENFALKIAKNDSKAEYTHDIRFDSTELWKIQKYPQKFENESPSRIKTKNRKREGLISSMNKIIQFDKEKYEQQMNELKANPEKLEFFRTSHVPSTHDKDLLINQYLKNQRRTYMSEPLDIKSDIYHINEENKKYNEKLDRAYHEYTTEIKQNLERGTAL
ncbi:uncharacterized protein cubi_00661 [Cryptosporidium ubiquitum]|uniref:Pre-mRNA-splicing factor SYF2 n=1 Tax=Cryptosporidium ubiquitum TaxID=857276 RepID=A0A1J4MG64_9CRYT|nr:uncharacterized protein cubi_00661 [Cryptosporidium ubiquitum]OII71853.1 hypothetical protein cubi_00661 [Cryptosporidium ubiquitum]